MTAPSRKRVCFGLFEFLHQLPNVIDGRRIGPDRFFEIRGGQSQADGQGEDIDRLLCVVFQKVRPQNLAGALVDEQFARRVLQPDPPGGEKIRGVLEYLFVSDTRSLSSFSVIPTMARGGMVKAALGMPV
jgi:hypothetical protein